MVATLERIRTGNVANPGAATFEDYPDVWLKAVEQTLRITTWRRYEQMLRLWVIPRVGRIKLADLTSQHLRRLQADLLKNGKVEGSALPHQSVANCRRAMKKVLSDAVKWGLMSSNPMTFVDAPRVISVSRPTWDATQAKAFLDAVASNELLSAWVLFLTTGTRRGEVAGLRSHAVDLDKASLAVRINRASAGQGNRVAEHPQKTKRGQHSIALDAGSIEALRAHRRRQLEDRLRAGPARTDTGFVFCGLDGLPLHPDTFTATFIRLRDPLPVRAITLHDLRHTPRRWRLRRECIRRSSPRDSVTPTSASRSTSTAMSSRTCRAKQRNRSARCCSDQRMLGDASTIPPDSDRETCGSKPKMATKVMALRRDGACTLCTTALPQGTRAQWDSVTKSLTCLDCVEPIPGSIATLPPPESAQFAAPAPAPVAPLAADEIPPIDVGTAGASARKEFERRHAKKEQQIEEKWGTGRLGKMAKFLSDDPQTTTAWAKGAKGEERVAEILGKRLDEDAVLLHDRKVPKTRGNIDHIAIAPSGVWVIDAKAFKGKVEKRDVGGFFKSDLRLYVGGRDQTKKVDGLQWQVDAVRKVLADDTIPVNPSLSFVGAEWPLFFAKPFQLNGVWISWPGKLAELILQDGPLSVEDVDHIARLLSHNLPAS